MSKDDGKLHRVRDRNDEQNKKWGTVWAVNLPFSKAFALKRDIAGKRKSFTVQTEPMEVMNPGDPPDGNPDGSWHPPEVAADGTPVALRVHAATAPQFPMPVTPALRPPPPPLGAASAAAAGAAAEAQRRHDAMKAREMAETEARKRQDELKALSEMNLDIQDDVPQGDVDDLLDGVNEPPPEEEVIPPPDVYPLPTATGVVVYYDKDGLPPDLEGSCVALVLKEWNDNVVTVQLGLELADLVMQENKVVGLKRLPAGAIMPGVPKSTAEIADRCWAEFA